MIYKLDLTKAIQITNTGYDANGQPYQEVTNLPLAAIVFKFLEQVSTFADAERAEPVITKTTESMKNFDEGKELIQDFTEEEFEVVFKVFKIRPTAEKLVFMHMSEKLNKDFSLIKYESELAKPKIKAQA